MVAVDPARDRGDRPPRHDLPHEDHPPPPAVVGPAADESELGPGVGGFYGPEWAPFLGAAPSSAFVADGSAVVVRRGVTLRDV